LAISSIICNTDGRASWGVKEAVSIVEDAVDEAVRVVVEVKDEDAVGAGVEDVIVVFAASLLFLFCWISISSKFC
jgi:hypothetical protein